MRLQLESPSGLKNKRPPVKLIQGLLLYYCSSFRAYIRPGQCESNRELARRAHSITNLMNGGTLERAESRLECLGCPGVVELCEREHNGNS